MAILGAFCFPGTGHLNPFTAGSEHVFQSIAEACSTLDAQLVLSMGGNREPSELGSLPGNPLVVRYAPQLEIVKRASAVVTHAGLNTVLESLAEGVPLVAIPQGNDQPGVAARIAHHKAGVVVPLRKLSVKGLRTAIDAVLRRDMYRAAAKQLQAAMRQVNGLEIASDVTEKSPGPGLSSAANMSLEAALNRPA
jgi:zeaxanthin glucosyltransferase